MIQYLTSFQHCFYCKPLSWWVSETHQIKTSKWIVRRMMWPPKTVLYQRKIVLQKLFLRARKKIGYSSVLDLRGWNSRIKVQADDTCCSSQIFILTWKVLSAMLFLCGRPLPLLIPLCTGPFHEEPEKNKLSLCPISIILSHKTEDRTSWKLHRNSLLPKILLLISSDKANKVTQVASILLEWNVAIFGCRTSCTCMQPNIILHIHLTQVSFEHFMLLNALFDHHATWWLPL